MDCLAILASSMCLLNVAGFSLRADFSTQIGGDVTHWNAGTNYGGATVGRVEISMPLVTYRGLNLFVGLRHESLLNTTRDRGEERIAFGVVYSPFSNGGAK